MSSQAVAANADVGKQSMSALAIEDEKVSVRETATVGNLVYDQVDVAPTFHARTYLALASMFFLNLVQVFALQGPPLVVCIMIFRGLKTSFPLITDIYSSPQ